MRYRNIVTLAEGRIYALFQFSFLELSKLIGDYLEVPVGPSHQVCYKFPCGSPGGLRLSVSREKDFHLCPNVWYTFEKIVKIKFDGIRGRNRKYRLRYNLIILIYSQWPLQHKVKFSEGFTVILNFYSRLNSIIGRNSLIGL